MKKFLEPQDLEFQTWEELFCYIYESKVNGQHKQSKELYESLRDTNEFYEYLEINLNKSADELDELKKYYRLNHKNK